MLCFLILVLILNFQPLDSGVHGRLADVPRGENCRHLLTADAGWHAPFRHADLLNPPRLLQLRGESPRLRLLRQQLPRRLPQGGGNPRE